MGLCRCVLHSPYEASSCSCSRQQLGVAESILTLLSGGSILSHRLIVLHTAFLHPEDVDRKYCSTHASALNHSPLVVNPILSPLSFQGFYKLNARSQGQTSISQYYMSKFFFCNRIKNLEPPIVKDAGRSHHSGGQGGRIKVQGQPELSC